MINSNKLAAAAVAFAAISLVVHILGSVVTLGFYTDPRFFPLWNDILAPQSGSIGLSFYISSFAFDIVIGAIFAYTFSLTRDIFKAKTMGATGMRYGIFLFVLTQVPTAFSTYLVVSVPFGLIIVWLMQGLIINILGAVSIVTILEAKK